MAWRWDQTRDARHGDGAIVVRDGRIVPGLVDSHVHFFQSSGLYTRPDVADLTSICPYATEQSVVRAGIDDTFRRYLVSGQRLERWAPTASPASSKSNRVSSSSLALVTPQLEPPSDEVRPPDEPRWRGCVGAATRYIPWQELLKRVHDIDALRCARCGGRLEFIAVILDEAAAHDILVSLGLPADKPVVARARAPTLWDDDVPVIDVA